MAESQKADTLAILVCYGQHFQECSSWISLRAASDVNLDWFVVDNSPDPTEHQEQIVYRHYPHNPGVSQAYLDGAAYAREYGYRWLLLLDQDTHFPIESWQVYREALIRWPAYVLYSPQLWSGKLGISPAPTRFGRPFASKTLPTGPYALTRYQPINAGMLVALDAYLTVGGHEPGVYLDFSDFAFIRKLCREYPYAVGLPLAMQHGLSGTEKKSFEQDYVRFKHYCKCMHADLSAGGPSFWRYFWTVVRASLLSYRHRSLRFFGLILPVKTKP